MRALFVNENIGGHATVHHHLRSVIGRIEGIDVDFIDVPEPGVLRRAAGAPVPGLARLDADLQPLRAQLALSAWVRRRLGTRVGRYDVVHLYTANAGLLSAGKLRRTPLVVSLDSTNALNAYRLPYRSPTRMTPITVAASKPFERRLHAVAEAIVANSAWAARSLVEDYDVAPRRLRVQPFGIEAPHFAQPAAPGTRAANGLPRIVFVGRQLERKGGLRLLRLHQKHFVGRAELVMVTPEPLPPAPGVVVIDDLQPGDPRLWDVLRDAAIFAFPSTIDQAPNVVLEAMAAGLPVVAIDTAAVPEMVDDGRTGLLVRPEAADHVLLEALERLLSDADLRSSMGERGRRRFDRRYEAGSCAEALVSVLEAAVGDAA